MSNVQEIALHLIRLPAWNSRIALDKKTPEGQKEQLVKLKILAESIKTHGVQTPIQVEEIPDSEGAYLLVFGTQRLAASKLAGKTTIPAIVVPASSDAARKVRNVMENALRTDLTPFEVARSASELKASGLNSGEVAQIMGLSKSHVDNSVAIMERGAPPVLFAFEQGHPAAKTVFLRQLVNERDHAIQAQKWDEECRRVEAEAAAKERGEKKAKAEPSNEAEGGGAPIRVKPARLNATLDFLAQGRTPAMLGNGRDTATKSWAKALMNWLVGGSETPPPGFPVPETDGEENEEQDPESIVKVPKGKKGGKK